MGVEAALCAVGVLVLASEAVSMTGAADGVPIALNLPPLAMRALHHTVILGPAEVLLGDAELH